MDWSTASARYRFLAEAFEGVGGFAPSVVWDTEVAADGSARTIPKTAARSHLVQYPRESAQKYAARSALATYENHLRDACERFTGFLGRRRAIRDGVDAPLIAAMLADCDQRGSSLDNFMLHLALHTKARGVMLVVLDSPVEPAQTLADQVEARVLPYLREITPESVVGYRVDPATGLFTFVSIAATHEIAGREEAVTRTWTESEWLITKGNDVIAQGPHSFGQCPVLALAESGGAWPHVGRYAQIADLSRRLFNAQSELDEILRGQTFSLLTLQVPPEAGNYDAGEAAAAIGTHSMLTHAGVTPAFIAPDSGPAATYLAKIEQLEQSIKRVQHDDATGTPSQRGSQVESGVSRRMRFEALNAELVTFAGQMQQVERRIWAMYCRALGINNGVRAEWPSDYNLVDSLAELDILAAMQATGFPDAALAAKRKTIAGAEFDTSDDATKTAINLAIDEQAQAAVTTPPTA